MQMSIFPENSQALGLGFTIIIYATFDLFKHEIVWMYDFNACDYNAEFLK